MKLLSCIICLLCSLSACTRPAAESKSLISSVEMNQALVSGPSDQALKFYSWYLKNIYLRKPVEVPELLLNEDSTQYHLDLTHHLEFLETSGYFSKRFYEREAPACKACAEKLLRINAKAVLRAGGSPIDPVDGTACAFLNWMPWTGGQGETLNTVAVLESKQKGDSALVTVMLGDSAEESYSYPRVTLLREQSSWKIARIDISYEK